MKNRGLTPREQEVLTHLAEAWNAFLLLSSDHDDEQADMRSAIHAAQYIVGTRVARRANPETWGNNGEVGWRKTANP